MKKLPIIFLIALGIILFIVSNVGDRNQPETKNEDPVLELFGWRREKFVEWAYEVWPIKEHKKFKQHRNKEPNEINLDEPYACTIYGVDDVNWATKYWEEVYLELPSPYEDLPVPVKRVLDCFDQNDVGKTIGEVVPELAKPIVVCYFRNGKLADYEPLAVRLLSLSDDKLKFRVKHEPFYVSVVNGLKSNDMVILYTEKKPGDEIKIDIRMRDKSLIKARKNRESKERAG